MQKFNVFNLSFEFKVLFIFFGGKSVANPLNRANFSRIYFSFSCINRANMDILLTYTREKKYLSSPFKNAPRISSAGRL